MLRSGPLFAGAAVNLLIARLEFAGVHLLENLFPAVEAEPLQPVHQLIEIVGDALEHLGDDAGRHVASGAILTVFLGNGLFGDQRL